MTDKDKKIFIKFGLWLGFLFLIIIIGISKTYALSISNLTMYYSDYNGNNYTDSSTSSAQWGAYYTTYINHNFGGGLMFDTPGTLYAFFNSGQGCSNKNCILTGQLVAKTDSTFSNNTLSSVRIQIEQAGVYKNCSVIGTSMEYNTYSYLTFQCASYNLNSGFNIVFSQFSAPSTTFIKYGIPLNDYTLQETATTDDVIVNDNKNTQNIINNNNTNTQNIINSNSTNTQSIIDNNNQNTQDIIDNQNNLNKETYYTCEDITPQYVTTLNGVITPVNNNLRLVNDTQNRKVVVYKFPKLSYTYTFTFNNYNRIRIGSSDTLYTQQQLVNTPYYLLYPIMVDDTPAISNDYDIYSDHEYVYFYLSSDASVDGSITFKPDESCINKLDEAEATRKGIFARLGELISTLFSNDDADISGLDNMVGWLPAGPLDSIINLPLNLFNSLTNVLSGTCTAVTLTLPFVNQQLILPCFDTFMSQYLTGFSTIWTFIGVTVSVFILYNYLLTLYKWVDDTLTMRENNLPGYYDDNWGGGA